MLNHMGPRGVLAIAICVGLQAFSPSAEAQLHNPCPYVNDGDCDEPNGLGYCAWGTDINDCANPNANYGHGSGYAGGTTSSGGVTSGATSGLHNPCPYTNDGDCDEPNGLGYCAWGTDTVDCSNPRSNYGNGSGYAGSTSSAAPTAPGTAPAATGDLRAQAVNAIRQHRYVGDTALAECVIQIFERNLVGNDLANVFRYFIWTAQYGWPGTEAERDTITASLGISRSFQGQADFNFAAARSVCRERM